MVFLQVIKIVSMADGCLTALDLLQLLTDINSRDFVEFVEMGFVLNYGGLLSLPPYVNEAANNDDNICQTLLNFWSTSE